ncbi:hypothetical protein NHX12_017027, partial [Muraenolepis orangiensis]
MVCNSSSSSQLQQVNSSTLHLEHNLTTLSLLPGQRGPVGGTGLPGTPGTHGEKGAP